MKKIAIISSVMIAMFCGCVMFNSSYMYAIEFDNTSKSRDKSNIRITELKGIIGLDGKEEFFFRRTGSKFPYVYLPEKQVAVAWTETDPITKKEKKNKCTVNVTPPKEFTKEYGRTIYFYLDGDIAFVVYSYFYDDDRSPKPEDRYGFPHKEVLDDGTEFSIQEYWKYREKYPESNIDGYKLWVKNNNP